MIVGPILEAGWEVNDRTLKFIKFLTKKKCQPRCKIMNSGRCRCPTRDDAGDVGYFGIAQSPRNCGGGARCLKTRPVRNQVSRAVIGNIVPAAQRICTS